MELVERMRIPKSCGFVMGHGCNDVTARGVCTAGDGTGMAFERDYFSQVFIEIPDFDFRITTTRDNMSAVWGENEGRDKVVVVGKTLSDRG